MSATILRVHSSSKKVSYLLWQDRYRNVKTTCHIKLHFFWLSKLPESLFPARYFIYVTATLNKICESPLNCVPCVLKTCSRTNVSCVLICKRALRVYVLSCKRVFCAHVPTCLACLRAHVLTCHESLYSSHVNIPCVLYIYIYIYTLLVSRKSLINVFSQ